MADNKAIDRERKERRAMARRLNKARNFPTNTCPASRHAQMIGEALVAGKPYPMLTEEACHCGMSILSTVASLYEERTELARLQAKLGVRATGNE